MGRSFNVWWWKAFVVKMEVEVKRVDEECLIGLRFGVVWRVQLFNWVGLDWVDRWRKGRIVVLDFILNLDLDLAIKRYLDLQK